MNEIVMLLPVPCCLLFLCAPSFSMFKRLCWHVGSALDKCASVTCSVAPQCGSTLWSHTVEPHYKVAQVSEPGPVHMPAEGPQAHPVTQLVVGGQSRPRRAPTILLNVLWTV
eukprot:246688-Chlamydomonas_euryale.AAC.1